MSDVGAGTGSYIILEDGRKGYIQRVTPDGYRFLNRDVFVTFYANGTAHIVSVNSGKIFRPLPEYVEVIKGLIPRYPSVDEYVEALEKNEEENERRREGFRKYPIF